MKQKNKHRGAVILKIYNVSTELQTDVGGGNTKNGWVKIKDAKSLWKKIGGYVTTEICTGRQRYQRSFEFKIIHSNGKISYRVVFKKLPRHLVGGIFRLGIHLSKVEKK